MTVNQSLQIRTAVGTQPGAMNNSGDVEIVQRLLNEYAAVAGFQTLPVNGLMSKQLINAIKSFQMKVVGLNVPDGRVDPNGVTLRKLNEHSPKATRLGIRTVFSDVYSHPDAANVGVTYGSNAVRLNEKAEFLLKCILASCGMKGGTVTSSLRTYSDQARITLTQTLPNKGESTVSQWYGKIVLEACKKFKGNVAGLEEWWRDYDAKRGKVSSKHLSNRALDVVPTGDRTKFAKKVSELIPVAGSGVQRIIPKGVMDEPVDHVEFTFPVTGGDA